MLPGSTRLGSYQEWGQRPGENGLGVGPVADATFVATLRAETPTKAQGSAPPVNGQ